MDFDETLTLVTMLNRAQHCTVHLIRSPSHTVTHTHTIFNTVRSESHCAPRLRYVDLVVSIEVTVEVCCRCYVTFRCIQLLNFRRRNFLLNFSTPCI